MRAILSLSISILSIVIGFAIMAGYCIAYGIEIWSIESASLVLFIFGAPTSFLNFILDKTDFYKGGFLKGVWNGLPIWLFYLLQYQLIAFLIYKGVINITTRKGIVCLVGITIIILISAKIAWNMLSHG